MFSQSPYRAGSGPFFAIDLFWRIILHLIDFSAACLRFGQSLLGNFRVGFFLFIILSMRLRL